MGEKFSKLMSDYCPESVVNFCAQIGQKRKRNLANDDDDALLEQSLRAPKRRKLLSTTNYIYQALFLDGRDSDITVEVLGKEWKLHKIYLQQSRYFASMFSGSWMETDKKYVKIEVTDPNITSDSLGIVLGSFYTNEVNIEPCNVIGVLAAATLLQLEGLIEQCLDIMVETISPLTAVSYYEAACQYGLQRIKQATQKWFCINLMTNCIEHPDQLRRIDVDLMTSLISDKHLIVVDAEFSLYMMLRFWVFLKLNPDWVYTNEANLNMVVSFFRDRPEEEPPFLLTAEGQDFAPAFQALRIPHLIRYLKELKALKEDRIMPMSWLQPALDLLWTNLLKVVEGTEYGPDRNVSNEEFFTSCLRFGRIFESNISSWRLKGFSFGVELSLNLTGQIMTVRVARRPDDFTLPRIQHARHNILLRVRLMSLDRQKQLQLSQCSGIVSLSLNRDTEMKLIDINSEMHCPLLVSVNILLITPPPKEKSTSHTVSSA